eukprot:gene3580-3628_t
MITPDCPSPATPHQSQAFVDRRAPVDGDRASWCDPSLPRRGRNTAPTPRMAWEHFMNKSRSMMMWRNSDPIRPPAHHSLRAKATPATGPANGAAHAGFRPRPTAGQRLAQALFDQAGPLARLVRHGETQWSSATFTGSRHTFVLRFQGTQALADAEALTIAIADDAVTIRGALIAELTVTAFTQTLLPEPEADIEVSALLLDQ